MKLEEYKPQAMRTAKIMMPSDMLTHGAMGCSSESGELAQTAADYADYGKFNLDNAIEELGDGVWFAEYVAGCMGWSLHELMEGYSYKVEKHRLKDDPLNTSDFVVSTLRYCAAGADIATAVKAHRFYGKPLNVVKLENQLRRYVATAINVCHVIGVEFSEVLAANVAKLHKRYPEAYSDKAAIERADKLTKEEV